MKRLIASGAALVALGAFLAFQPVAGGAEGVGGLNFAPVEKENSAPVAPPPIASAKPAPDLPSDLSNRTNQGPTITGGPHGDDDEYEEDYEEDDEEDYKEDDIDDEEDEYYEEDDD